MSYRETQNIHLFIHFDWLIGHIPSTTETKGYYFYLADEQKVFVSLKAIFLEKEFLGEGTVASKVELEEVRQVEKSTQVTEPEPYLVRSNLEPIVPVPLR